VGILISVSYKFVQFVDASCGCLFIFYLSCFPPLIPVVAGLAQVVNTVLVC